MTEEERDQLYAEMEAAQSPHIKRMAKEWHLGKPIIAVRAFGNWQLVTTPEEGRSLLIRAQLQ